jgi:AcrR family transcriptional regulator
VATRARSSPKRRPPLNRERVLRAAVKLADERGLEALSMRKLGQALGVEAMSLYNHVANKDDVLDGMVETVAKEIEPPSPDEEWQTAIRQSAVSAHQTLRRHRWAPTLMMSPTSAAGIPTRMRYMESLLGRLRDAGFSPDLTYHAYHVLDAHVFGFSLWQATHSLTTREDLSSLAADFLRDFPLDDYPHVAEHIEQHMSEGPHQEVSAFEFSLDLILDGLRKALEAS